MSETRFPLEALSSTIAHNASAVSNYLRANHVTQPSFDSDGPPAVVPNDSPPYVQQARHELIAAALEMVQLATGPSEFLPNLATGVRLSVPTMKCTRRRTYVIVVSIYLLPVMALSL